MSIATIFKQYCVAYDTECLKNNIEIWEFHQYILFSENIVDQKALLNVSIIYVSYCSNC